MPSPHELTVVWQDGREATVRANEGTTVLEAVDEAGIGLPFGCRTGACGTCVGRLIEGRISYGRPPRALKPRDVEAGYLLCCIARPQTNCRIEVGTDVLTALTWNSRK